MSTQTQILESIYIIYNHGRFFYVRLQIQIMALVTIEDANRRDITTAVTHTKIRFLYSPFGEYYYLDWLSTQNFIERRKFKSKLVN